MTLRWTVALGLLLSAHTVSAETVGRPAEWGDEQKERFLMEAKISGDERVSRGITGTRRLTLSDGIRMHDASWQTVDEFKLSKQTPRGTEINFRDSYRYNIAAYKLDRLLGLRMIPVSVERKIGGNRGALTWWIDDVLMLELERYKKKITPPSPQAWNDRILQARIFNELVFNTDPNLGNLVITTDWKLWMIDFSRAFRTFDQLRAPKNVRSPRVDRTLLAGLRALSAETLDAAVGDYLLKAEKRAVLARRDLLVAHIDRQIEERGEAVVLFDMPR